MNRTSENIRITVEALKLFGVVVEIGKYAPGDGWTRYSVTVNGWNDIHNGMSAAECHAYLSGMFDMLRVQQQAARPVKPLPNDDGGRTAAGNECSDSVDLETLFSDAQDAQASFWKVLADLEDAAEIEIDGTRDLNDLTLSDLLQ